jgi:hypothetical protein
MTPNVYASVNRDWPATIPPITRIEAERAAKRIVKRFGAPPRLARVRRCWISLDPARSSDLSRGWRRLVHDLSHLLYRANFPGARPHGGFHAGWERDVRDYVLARGWLDGTLKLTPAVKKKGKPSPADKLAAAEAKLIAWERREKRAATKVKKYKRMVARLGRTVARTLVAAS